MKRVKGARRNLFFKQLTKIVTLNPDVTFSQLPPELKVSNASFARWKKQILAGETEIKDKVKTKRSIDYTAVEVYLKANPAGSYRSFLEANPGFEISDACFYAYRRKMTGSSVEKKRAYGKNKNRTYFKICSFPSASYNDDAKKLLKDFLQVLRDSGKARFEMIELIEPREIEVREEHK